MINPSIKAKIQNFLRKKTRLLLLFLLTVLLLFSRDYILQWTVPNPENSQRPQVGITFIHINAESLKLDWKKTFRELVNDLGFAYVRVPVFWDQIESAPGKFYWGDLDWQMEESAKAKAKVLLVVGHRVPRYPECYAPAWTKTLNEAEFKQVLFKMIEATIEHFKTSPALEGWQIENEPQAKILGKIWGENCRDVLPLLKDEIKLVKAIDPVRPTVVSFAFTPWMASQLNTTLEFNSDIAGLTVFNKLFFRSPIFNGYVEMFRLGLIAPLRLAYQKKVAADRGKKFWVVELQAEPWGPKGPYEFDYPGEAEESMNATLLKETWTRVTEAGISRIYLWGAEWWLSERQKGNSAMLETVQSLLKLPPNDLPKLRS